MTRGSGVCFTRIETEQKVTSMVFTKLFEKLQQRGYEFKELSPTHFRVEAVLDLYPVNCRWHNVATNQRGGWIQHRREPDMVKFIDDQVRQADAILDNYIKQTGLKVTDDGEIVEPQSYELQRSLGLGEKKRFLSPGDGPWWARIGAK